MKILIADKFEKEGLEQLNAAGCEVIYDPELKDDALRDAVARSACDVLVVRSTKVKADALNAGRGLKVVIRAGSGVDTIDIVAATARGIRVSNCPGKNSVAVAELTIGLMIALDRRIVDETDDLRRGIWNKKEYSKARGLKGRTLGIIGLGRIGYEVAARARAFEMTLIYHDVIAHPDMERELGMRRATLDELLKESDFVTLHIPGGAETKHLIGRAELARMKPTAFLVNCSRGGVVDEKALGEAVSSGMIGGAALDVYEIEPAAPAGEFTDPIPKCPKVYGTHHVGASTDQAQDAVAQEVVRIVRRYMDAGEVVNCVNPCDKATVSR
ncbi:MAG: hydroxyacid dehydrogenase [Planctomycetota bacterium]